MIRKVSIRRSKSYEEILSLQKEEFNQRINCRRNGISLPGDVVFFVEHNPVYTLGCHGNRQNLLISKEMLNSKGIEYYEIDRGGDITYHGPGQITVYPILDMERYKLGVKEYVNLMEEIVIRTLREFDLKGERIEGKSGVWIGKNTENERKICALGIRCSRHITMHGFALNVGPDMEAFTGINPCGLGRNVTSISLEKGMEVEIEKVEGILWKHLTSLLQLRIPFQENS